MRSIGDLMKELGFNPESSENTQKAFIKNLIKAAADVAPSPTPIHVGAPKPKAETHYVASVKTQPVQMEFDLTATDDSKKVS